jgi:hypothetical protein
VLDADDRLASLMRDTLRAARDRSAEMTRKRARRVNEPWLCANNILSHDCGSGFA